VLISAWSLAHSLVTQRTLFCASPFSYLYYDRTNHILFFSFQSGFFRAGWWTLADVGTCNMFCLLLYDNWLQSSIAQNRCSHTERNDERHEIKKMKIFSARYDCGLSSLSFKTQNNNTRIELNIIIKHNVNSRSSYNFTRPTNAIKLFIIASDNCISTANESYLTCNNIEIYCNLFFSSGHLLLLSF